MKVIESIKTTRLTTCCWANRSTCAHLQLVGCQFAPLGAPRRFCTGELPAATSPSKGFKDTGRDSEGDCRPQPDWLEADRQLAVKNARLTDSPYSKLNSPPTTCEV